MTDPDAPQLIPGIDLDPYAWTTPATTDAVREALAGWSPDACCEMCPCRNQPKEGDAK